MDRWTIQAVERAAPDASSLAAARRLARPGPWSETGSTDTLVWGRCQGSGHAPYQVSVDLDGPAYRCSCPSRKFPCKHALALLLLWVHGNGSVEQAEAPADVARAWAEQRAERAAAAAGDGRRPADPEARARRIEQRRALMDAGIEEFSLWLEDLVRGGTVQAKRQSWAWWDQAAARLVDAQVPGLAEQVRTVGSEVARRDDWADFLLVELGRWWTATRAWRSWDRLDDATRGDLRALLGWAQATDDIRAGDTVRDRWLVLGAHRSLEGRLQQQRTWLRGETTGETVQVLDFAAGPNPLPIPHLAGSVLEVALARYPGHRPRRALFVEPPIPVDRRNRLGHATDLDGALGRLADTWADNPWTLRAPVVIRAAVVPSDGTSPAWVRDETGAGLPIVEHDGLWPLLAVTGGHPATMFGEIMHGAFRPLTVEAGDRLVAL